MNTKKEVDFKKLCDTYNKVSTDWFMRNRLEADEVLNSASIDFLKKYLDLYPSSVAIKINEGSVKPLSEIDRFTTFCCDTVVNAKKSDVAIIEMLLVLWKTENKLKWLNALYDLYKKTDAIKIWWS